MHICSVEVLKTFVFLNLGAIKINTSDTTGIHRRKYPEKPTRKIIVISQIQMK
jgi:hypothetical protein